MPSLFKHFIDESQISHKQRAHPFGIQIKCFQAKMNLTLEDLKYLSDVPPSVISRMCNGERLEGTLARERILRIIYGLSYCGVLKHIDEANALLDSAKQPWLERGTTEADDFLLDTLSRADSSQESKPEIATVLEEVEIYKGAADYLVQNKSKNIRVYAPLALWQRSLYKKQYWFSVIADYLSKNLDAQAQMVFGVPHRKNSYEYMKDMLSVFQSLETMNGTSNKKAPSMSIRYIPPIRHQDPPPAIGMIIFDSEVVAIGFGVRDAMEKIDTGWVLFDKLAATTAKEWFDSKIWPKYQLFELMRTQPRLQRMCDGFSLLEEKYADRFTDD